MIYNKGRWRSIKKIEIVMRKIEETDNISEMVLASFTDKEMQQDISISRIWSLPGVEIHLKEQTVYKDGVRIPCSHY